MFVSVYPPLILLSFLCRYFSWRCLLRSVPFNADCRDSFEADYKSKLAVNFSPWRRKTGVLFGIAPLWRISSPTWADLRAGAPTDQLLSHLAPNVTHTVLLHVSHLMFNFVHGHICFIAKMLHDTNSSNPFFSSHQPLWVKGSSPPLLIWLWALHCWGGRLWRRDASVRNVLILSL